jgi:ribonuclease HI
MCPALAGCSGRALPVNSEEDTRIALAEITEPSLRCYTDGGCDGNGAQGEWGAAGWGAHVLSVDADGEKERVEAELWGPVETNPGSPWFCGAERGTNNTGELIGIGQALLWLRDIDTTVMLYDSGYAANMTDGRWQPNSNQLLVQWTRGLLAQVKERREVHWVHVRGHSGDGGNDRADELVQWGKEAGPYARLRSVGGGEGDSRWGVAATREVDEAAREAGRAGNAVRAGAAKAGGAGGAVRRGDMLVKYGLIGEAELARARETLLADADALVARATNREGNSCGSDREPRENGQRGTPQGSK